MYKGNRFFVNFNRSKENWMAEKCQSCPKGQYAYPGASECRDCPPGSYNPIDVYGTLPNVTKILFSCMLCPPGKYGDQYKATDAAACKDCPALTFGFSPYNVGDKGTGTPEGRGGWGSTICETCPVGSHIVNGTCLVCEHGMFSDIENATECSVCPLKYGDCENGKITIKSGVWFNATHNATPPRRVRHIEDNWTMDFPQSVVQRCPHHACYFNTSNKSREVDCCPGYEGAQCAKCAKGHYRLGQRGGGAGDSQRCRPCDARKDPYYLVATFATLGFLLFVIVYALQGIGQGPDTRVPWTTLHEAEEEEASETTLGMLRQNSGGSEVSDMSEQLERAWTKTAEVATHAHHAFHALHLQLIFLQIIFSANPVGLIDLEWIKENHENIEQIMQGVSNTYSRWTTCVLMGQKNQVDEYYRRLLAYFVLFFVLVIIVVLAEIIRRCFVCRYRAHQNLRHAVEIIIILLAVLLYPAFNSTIVKGFWCNYGEPDLPVRWQEADFLTPCWQPATITLVFVGFLAWSITLPLAVTFKLWYRRKQLRDPAVLLRYGMFYEQVRSGASVCAWVWMWALKGVTRPVWLRVCVCVFVCTCMNHTSKYSKLLLHSCHTLHVCSVSTAQFKPSKYWWFAVDLLRVAGYSFFNHFPEVERLIFCVLYSFAFFSLHLYIQPYGTRWGNVSQNAQQVIICLLFVLSSMLLAVSSPSNQHFVDPLNMTGNGKSSMKDAVCCSGHGTTVGGTTLNCSCDAGWSGSVCSHNVSAPPSHSTHGEDGDISVQFKEAHYTLLVLLVVAIIAWVCIFVWSIFGMCTRAIVRAGVQRYKQYAEARRKNNAHWASYEDPLMDDDREEAKSMEQQHVQRPRGSSLLPLMDFESKSTVVVSEKSLDDDAGSAAGDVAWRTTTESASSSDA